MADLRVGLVGLGSMGRHHARVVRETPGLQLVAIADAVGDTFGVAKGLPVLPDVTSLVKEGIDAAIVAVPTIHHEAAALELAAAGVHTMVEKPIAHTREAGERMAAAFAAAGLVGAVGYVERCNPALLELRRRLRGGQLGQIYSIHTSRQGPFPARISDVGVVKDLATHDIDLTAWLTGSPYASVSAQVTRITGRPHEDMVVVAARLSDGTIASHVVNWLSPRKDRQTIVTGELGAFVADTASGDLTFHHNGQVQLEWDVVANFRGVTEGDVVRYAFAKREPLRVQAENFRDAIVDGAVDKVVSLSEGVETLAVVDAVLASARDGGVVTLSPGSDA